MYALGIVVQTAIKDSSNKSSVNAAAKNSTKQSTINLLERCFCKGGRRKGHYHCRMCIVVSTRKADIIAHEIELHGEVQSGLQVSSQKRKLSLDDDCKKVVKC